MVSIGPNTVTDPDALRLELEAIRANRIAYEREEATAKVGCVAAPILDWEGRPIAALSVSIHLHVTDLSKMAPAVATVAMALSRETNRTSLALSGG